MGPLGNYLIGKIFLFIISAIEAKPRVGVWECKCDFSFIWLYKPKLSFTGSPGMEPQGCCQGKGPGLANGKGQLWGGNCLSPLVPDYCGRPSVHLFLSAVWESDPILEVRAVGLGVVVRVGWVWSVTSLDCSQTLFKQAGWIKAKLWPIMPER